MRRATGVALITVMLVVALATLAATALLSSSSIAIHRTAALRDSEQGWWVARGVEAWVLGILAKSAKDGYDGLDQPWAQPVDHLPVDEGFVRGGIVDLQGRFNLNNLEPYGIDQQGNYARQFASLVQSIADAQPGIKLPANLVAAIQDWIDADPMPRPGGAEDSAYMQLDPPYRAANQRFTAVSELLAVQGMSPELYAALRNLVCVLPNSTATKINVNTAPIPVLMALSAHADAGKLHDWDTHRKDHPITNGTQLATFMNSGALGPDAQPYVDYRTQYFQIQGEVFVGSSRVALYSLINRAGNATPTVLAHSADVE